MGYLEGEECVDLCRCLEVNSRLEDVFFPDIVWVDNSFGGFSFFLFFFLCLICLIDVVFIILSSFVLMHRQYTSSVLWPLVYFFFQ